MFAADYFFLNRKRKWLAAWNHAFLGGTWGHKHLPESPVAAVSQEGCEVRSWKLQPSLCLQRPPCNCGGGKAKTQLAVRLSLTLSNASLCHWCKLFSKEKNNWKGPKCYPHNGVDSSTVTFPHASEARLTTDVPYLRGEERSLNAQALERWAQSCRPERPEWFQCDLQHYLLRGHTFIVTLPLVTFRILKPTVGIMSSLNWPDCCRRKQKVGEETGENVHSQKKNQKTKTQCWERTDIKTAWCFTAMRLSLLTFKTQIAFLIYVWNFTKQNSLRRIVCQWLWLWPKSHVKHR